jgi:hypothetical protein
MATIAASRSRACHSMKSLRILGENSLKFRNFLSKFKDWRLGSGATQNVKLKICVQESDKIVLSIRDNPLPEG